MSIAPQRRSQTPSAAANKVHTLLTVSHICRQHAHFAEDLSLSNAGQIGRVRHFQVARVRKFGAWSGMTVRQKGSDFAKDLSSL